MIGEKYTKDEKKKQKKKKKTRKTKNKFKFLRTKNKDKVERGGGKEFWQKAKRKKAIDI